MAFESGAGLPPAAAGAAPSAAPAYARREALPALISLHDVMPQQLPRIEALLQALERRRLHATLLVVPGCDWQARQLAALRDWHGRGHALAAHGWQHRAHSIRGLHHRLHAALLSRDAAEHLALTPPERVALMRRSHAWFAAHDLPAPSLYVPPAWALGRLPAAALASLPFACIEDLAGVITRSGRRRLLPLVGFEADTVPRAAFLRRWNHGQVALARRLGRPLRIGIHPQDHQLLLSGPLWRLLAQPLLPLRYEALPG